MNLTKICSSNFSKMCRICLKIEENLSTESNFDIFNKLNVCFSIQMSQDETLPKALCESCIENINLMYEFKQLCTYSQRILGNILVYEALNALKVPEPKEETTSIKNEIPAASKRIKLPKIPTLSDQEPKCSVCSKMFRSVYSLRDHMLTHRPLEERIKYCLYCDKKYINDEKYQRHLKLHKNQKGVVKHPKKTCELCGKSVASMWTHMRDVHSEKKFQCPECEMKFFFKCRLEKHIDVVHKNIKAKKSNLCSECGKTFGSTRDFRSHLAIHEGKKLYKCEPCGREFTFHSSYRSHMNKHHFKNVKKNFSCSYCGKKFESNSLVQNHIVVHTGEQPYSCKVCERRFSHSAAMRTHMKIHNLKQ